MNSDTRRKVDYLYCGHNNKTTMTKKEIEATIDEVGTEIIVHGQLRTIVFKKIIGTRYQVSTTPFK